MELGLPARFVIAFVIVLVLIMLTAWLIRRFSGGRALPYGWVKGREHRIEVVDAAAVDAKRRLVLVRRDDVEHLVMIGGGTDLVVEQGIAPPPTVARGRAAQKTGKAIREKPSITGEAGRPETATPPETALAKQLNETLPGPRGPATSAQHRPPPESDKNPPPSSGPAAAPPAAPGVPRDTDQAPADRGMSTHFNDMTKRLEAALKPVDLSRHPPVDKSAPTNKDTGET